MPYAGINGHFDAVTILADAEYINDGALEHAADIYLGSASAVVLKELGESHGFDHYLLGELDGSGVGFLY